MAYNSAYTGTQIDSAVGAVIQKESAWDGKGGRAEIFSVSLPASGWSGNAQTVSHSLLKAAGYGYIYNPDTASYEAYLSAQVHCGDVVTDGQVTFYCQKAPADDITVQFMRSEANENV